MGDLEIIIYAILAYGVYSYAKSQAPRPKPKPPIAGVGHDRPAPVQPSQSARHTHHQAPAIKIIMDRRANDECGDKTEW